MLQLALLWATLGNNWSSHRGSSKSHAAPKELISSNFPRACNNESVYTGAIYATRGVGIPPTSCHWCTMVYYSPKVSHFVVYPRTQNSGWSHMVINGMGTCKKTVGWLEIEYFLKPIGDCTAMTNHDKWHRRMHQYVAYAAQLSIGGPGVAYALLRVAQLSRDSAALDAAQRFLEPWTGRVAQQAMGRDGGGQQPMVNHCEKWKIQNDFTGKSTQICFDTWGLNMI